MTEEEFLLKTKAYHILRGISCQIEGVLCRENPNLDPFWALDEIATKLKELTIAFEAKNP